MNPLSAVPTMGIPSRMEVPPATERALEVSLLPAVDSFVAAGLTPGLQGAPRSVQVDGEVTRSDDASYRRSIHVQKTFDRDHAHATLTGVITGTDGAAPVTLREDFSYSLAGSSTVGRVGDAPEEFLQSPHGGSLVNNGQVGDYDVQSRTVWSGDGVLDHHGYIYHRDAQHRIDEMVPYSRRTTTDSYGTYVVGQFGSLPERGIVHTDGAGRVTMDRVVGPFVIHETIRSERD